MNKEKLARIAWEGDSKKVISGFPKAVKEDLGFALLQLQDGKIPPNIRPMKSIGPGVFEIKEADERAWYRVIHLSKIADTIHVLHCFEKESAKTSKKGLETAKIRLSRVKQRVSKGERK